ncbi:helix-turn-helix transcriptional regulator [Duganella sp. CT11-25]|uniref:helix-turn-helix transcriptional regulator n=1 Tax=unclassified Duganella TaxID=2636909 RepID=UPI0039AFC984
MNMAEMKVFVRLPAVMAATGLSRTTIYERIKAGIFPAPISIGPRAVAWDAGAIAAWQVNCIKEGRAGSRK